MSDTLMDGLNSEDDEEWVRTTPGWESKLATKAEGTPSKKRQQKVITLDEILEEDQRESIRKLKPRKTNPKLEQRLLATAHLYATSSEDDDEEEWRKPTELLEELEKEVAVVADEVEVEWGLEVLGAGTVVEAPALVFQGPPPVQRALQAAKEAKRETTLEEVARAGFLRPWACWRDEATVRWAYHCMAYSPDEALERACCSFLCDLVRSSTSTSPEWLPSPPDFQETFITYGYREHKEEESERSDADRSTKPPPNFRSLLHFISEYLATHSPPHDATHLTTLLRTTIHLSLERKLLPLLGTLQTCILALLRSFKPQDWSRECASIAPQISTFTEKPQNAVHVLNILSGLGSRSVGLQRHLALLQLTRLSRRRELVVSAREVTALFLDAQLRGSFVDFKRWFYLLVIADVFLWCNQEFSGDSVARYAWVKFLGACSVISVGDERPFASKLRNLASFLVTRYGEGELEEEERFEED